MSGVAELRHVTRVKALPNSTAVELERPLPFQLLPEWSPAVLVWNPATQEVKGPKTVLRVRFGLWDNGQLGHAIQKLNFTNCLHAPCRPGSRTFLSISRNLTTPVICGRMATIGSA